MYHFFHRLYSCRNLGDLGKLPDLVTREAFTEHCGVRSPFSIPPEPSRKGAQTHMKVLGRVEERWGAGHACWRWTCRDTVLCGQSPSGGDSEQVFEMVSPPAHSWPPDFLEPLVEPGKEDIQSSLILKVIGMRSKKEK